MGDNTKTSQLHHNGFNPPGLLFLHPAPGAPISHSPQQWGANWELPRASYDARPGDPGAAINKGWSNAMPNNDNIFEQAKNLAGDAAGAAHQASGRLFEQAGFHGPVAQIVPRAGEIAVGGVLVGVGLLTSEVGIGIPVAVAGAAIAADGVAGIKDLMDHNNNRILPYLEIDHRR